MGGEVVAEQALPNSMVRASAGFGPFLHTVK
jgi:hypothetical protein